MESSLRPSLPQVSQVWTPDLQNRFAILETVQYIDDVTNYLLHAIRKVGYNYFRTRSPGCKRKVLKSEIKRLVR